MIWILYRCSVLMEKLTLVSEGTTSRVHKISAQCSFFSGMCDTRHGVITFAKKYPVKFDAISELDTTCGYLKKKKSGVLLSPGLYFEQVPLV